MRRFVITLFLTVWALPGVAFEVEEQRDFGSGTGSRIEILSTTDTENFAPLIEAFIQKNPAFSVRYTVTSSQQLHQAISAEGVAPDLAVSSAMDLQMKLANDGFGRVHVSAQTQALPAWAKWRDTLFAFTQEPVVLLISQAAFAGLDQPQTRHDLIRVIRENPETFQGKIGTYDPSTSGAGYLFATQDARHSDTFWRLSEVMGALDPILYSASSSMISDLRNGKISIAYNVLGPYAEPRLRDWADGRIIELQDHTNVLLRTAFIPSAAASPERGALFLDFLLSEAGQNILQNQSGLPRIDESALARHPHLRPIRLDPGLLVYVDPLKRSNFLKEWHAAIVQP